MKKLLFLAGICLSAGFADGQTMAAHNDSTIVDSHNNTIGYLISPPGRFRSWYGWMVEDSHHNTLGCIKKEGDSPDYSHLSTIATITDSHYSTIGYLKSDGTLEDSHHSVIGHAKSNEFGPGTGKIEYNIVFKKLFFK